MGLIGLWNWCLGRTKVCSCTNCVALSSLAANFSQAMRSIDFAFAKARRDGKTFPHELLPKLLFRDLTMFRDLTRSFLRLWLQADNACKEVRNQATGRLSALLCQAGYFTSISENHLEVGHTHEDVGMAVFEKGAECLFDAVSLLAHC